MLAVLLITSVNGLGGGDEDWFSCSPILFNFDQTPFLSRVPTLLRNDRPLILSTIVLICSEAPPDSLALVEITLLFISAILL